VGLGLRVTAGVTAAVAAVVASSWGPVATAVDQGSAWTVTVGSASRVLYPGTEATMGYDVRNATSAPLRLQGTTASVHPKAAAVGCAAQWFRVSSNAVPAGAEVAPGATVHGTLVLAFDDAAAVSHDSCQNIPLDVVVTAS
jgi:hypothetical protein